MQAQMATSLTNIEDLDIIVLLPWQCTNDPHLVEGDQRRVLIDPPAPSSSGSVRSDTRKLQQVNICDMEFWKPTKI